MKPFLDDERYGSVVLAVVLSSPTHSERKMAPIIAALKDFGPPKPVVFAMMGEDSEVAPEIIAKLRGLGVPFFRSPERALRALARLAALRAPQPAPPAPAVERGWHAAAGRRDPGIRRQEAVGGSRHSVSTRRAGERSARTRNGPPRASDIRSC